MLVVIEVSVETTASGFALAVVADASVTAGSLTLNNNLTVVHSASAAVLDLSSPGMG
jgi:hypothetical protein